MGHFGLEASYIALSSFLDELTEVEVLSSASFRIAQALYYGWSCVIVFHFRNRVCTSFLVVRISFSFLSLFLFRLRLRLRFFLYLVEFALLSFFLFFVGRLFRLFFFGFLFVVGSLFSVLFLRFFLIGGRFLLSRLLGTLFVLLLFLLVSDWGFLLALFFGSLFRLLLFELAKFFLNLCIQGSFHRAQTNLGGWVGSLGSWRYVEQCANRIDGPQVHSLATLPRVVSNGETKRTSAHIAHSNVLSEVLGVRLVTEFKAVAQPDLVNRQFQAVAHAGQWHVPVMIEQGNSVAHVRPFECTASNSLGELAADYGLVIKASCVTFNDNLVVFFTHLKP